MCSVSDILTNDCLSLGFLTPVLYVSPIVYRFYGYGSNTYDLRLVHQRLGQQVHAVS